MTIREMIQEHLRGGEFFDSLSQEQRFQIGDDLVLGEFDWSEWFDCKPSRAFINGIDEARTRWEMSATG